ncbi:MAG: UvrY/SirA/GacA family response regulator transcription factor [Proteobacteria bacterium]|nr:UvrY/SirA/GacA family response regulator transcription factor [Pseudomonadota bacterium]
MIRILVVDDHRLFRMGLVRMLRDVKGLQILGEAATGEEAISKAREMKPNIVLMDIIMPGIGGIEATRRIVCSNPDVKVIALTACNEDPFPLQMLKAGASGYLTKEIDPDELNLAIRKVFLGKRYLCAEVAQHLAIRTFDDHESPFEQLSSREMQIMMMVINCQKVSSISVNLHLSPKTVNSYRYRIFEKLNVSSDVELALLAVRHGMVGPRVQHAAHSL